MFDFILFKNVFNKCFVKLKIIKNFVEYTKTSYMDFLMNYHLISVSKIFHCI